MKKIYILLIITAYLYGCTARETAIPVKLKIIENREAVSSVPVNLKAVPLYEKNIEYTGELPLVDYLFTDTTVNIRGKPSTNGKILGRTKIHEKIEVLGTVRGERIQNNRLWYKVRYKNYTGYLHSSVIVKREFRFEEMAKRARNLDLFIMESKVNNRSIERVIQYNPGSSEAEGAPVDMYGNRGEQSIIGIYTNPAGKSSLRYLSDGRIVSVKERGPGEALVTIPDSMRTYKIESGKTQKIDLKDGINKIIVIDLDNQNQGIFLKKDDVWQLISYSLITSGKNNNRDSYETPKGYFLVGNTVRQVIFSYEKKVKKQDLNGEVVESITEKGIVKEYNKDHYEIVKKYSRANYGIRFSGGGYIHGIPLSDDTVKVLGNEKAVKERKERAIITLGTYKRSHKCVRSPEEHESFLYHDFVGYDPKYEGKWWRLPKGNVAVIVF
ncbi:MULTISPECIES: SH3 domain-containing protein [Psychrilyobacter]|uniref:SH3 domain-containing protein n=1 Tax=Psychrilyobacter piezotolerans TaxID=2293438 RepID=A0ABX9KI95_9FUSO|nr:MULTISPECIES: SH3 domain-containing protein [Psychrilyobacter]MCS5420264.1 SH3 domain-containing protein [Psychrilyobacter sp. S5]NDI77289.1 SH3 domain-containing protein [Psychrilyobacter piezotolerans]RDE63343.1 SH3 domain-containing protein [Psychrilyobacter sp. S5]REI41885.1 SH3 domain-containing protein [Psychrilyobacter piezotolerans]